MTCAKNVEKVERRLNKVQHYKINLILVTILIIMIYEKDEFYGTKLILAKTRFHEMGYSLAQIAPTSFKILMCQHPNNVLSYSENVSYNCASNIFNSKCSRT